MRLKSLTLNGYKTFASKTYFEFGDGITCIIGPNGSGKSNVADGIRWALGEQSFSLLRGKRTDDMIFSGSAKRSRASMAEVILTFDNSDGFFPIEFNEIEIGRRAFRDGANEYVLNSNRVRLRDVGDLLSHSGLSERTYTVIGQGLVDNALAQKPEERRALFEEAAGIAAYRDRREDALRKLDETRHNIERAQDIMAEITPRLASLERQSTRARQYQTLKAELDGLTRTYFGFYYQRVLRSIQETAQTHDKAKQAAAEALAAVNDFDAQADSLRARRTGLRNQLGELTPRRESARSAREAALRTVAVLRERALAMDAQIARADQDLNEQANAIVTLRNRANEATMLMATARANALLKQADLDNSQSASSSDRQAKEDLEAQRSAARQALINISAGIVSRQKQIAIISERQDALRNQIEALGQRTAQIGRQRDEEITRRDHLLNSLDGDARQTNLFDGQFDEASNELLRATAALTTATSAFAAAEAEEKLTARFNFFADMRAQLSADDLAQSLMDSGIPHVRGTLNAFIQVLPDDLKAVEAALGDLLHAVIIAGPTPQESAASLAQVRAWLTEQGNGRLAIIPDNVRELDEERIKQDAALAEHARSHGARLLIDSIQAPEALRPVLQLIAGGAFIARDLTIARELALELVDGCVVVTRDGEAAFPVGTMTLPAGVRAPVILGAAEADTPEAVEAAKLLDPETARENLTRADAELKRAHQVHLAAKQAVDNAQSARDLFARESVTRKSQLDEAGRRIEKLEESLAVIVGDMEAAEREIVDIDAQIGVINQELSHQQGLQQRAQEVVHDVEVKLTAVMAGGWFEAINASQNALALARAALQSNEQVVFERVNAQRAALAQRGNRAKTVSDLRAQQQALLNEQNAAAAAVTAAETALSAAEAAMTPVQQQISEVEGQLAEHDNRKRETERNLRECETKLNAAALELARNNDALTTMRQRAAEMIAEEGSGTGAADATNAAGARAEQASEPAPAVANEGVDAYLSSLPIIEELTEGLEDRLNQLRGQIKRLGAINFEAQTEYDELKKRSDFITEQSADLGQASEQLRQVIAELNDTIKVTFKQTFDAINEAFQNTFKVLFGGGQAKLTLINADNVDESAVEIQAQPPGKRPQSLALLSGGERSLTATSLLFAILQVKPTPFCVLDEVDAALDESNVGRFRGMVESLSDSTQFIIITHNRRTVEAATTIYGISMAADGASTALSLKLDDVKQDE
jgi:chromosome segregation protein